MSELKVPCDSVVLLRLIYHAIEQTDLDYQSIRNAYGVTDEVLNDHQFRFPHALQVGFWRYIEELTGDPCVGVKIGQHLPIYRGQVVEYFFYSSHTFGQALDKASRFHRIITDAVSVDLQRGNGVARIYVNHQLDEGEYLRHFIECLLMGICRFFSATLENQFKPLRLGFAHHARGDVSIYEEAIGCAVVFEQASNFIEFDETLLDTPSMHAEPELAQLHEAHAVGQLQRLMRRDLIQQLDGYFQVNMGLNEVSLGGAAEELKLPVRQLRQELADVGTSFNQLFGEFRSKRAKQFLADPNLPIEEIVALTGFSEPSTFYRAFKRWTGKTPLEYRRTKNQV